MSVSNYFREIVVAALQDDPAVEALVARRIFDETPGMTVAPYIYIGEINRQRVEIGCGKVATLRMRIYVVSTDAGREEAWQVEEAIWQALDGHQVEPSEGQPWIMQGQIDALQSGDVVEPLNPKSTVVEVTATFARA